MTTCEIKWDGEGTAVLTQWFFSDGDNVVENDIICELSQEKVISEIVAPASGQLSINIGEDSEINAGDLVATISS